MLKTNSVVSHFVPLVNDTCSFGCNHRETISELYWGCPLVNQFWNNVKNFFLLKQLLPAHYTKLTVLFGIHDQTPDSVENILIMVAKRYIWQEKFRNLNPTFIAFAKYLLNFLETMKIVSIIKNKEGEFYGQWGTIIDTLSDRIEDEPHRVEE